MTLFKITGCGSCRKAIVSGVRIFGHGFEEVHGRHASPQDATVQSQGTLKSRV